MASKRYVDFKRFKQNVPWELILGALEIRDRYRARGQTLLGPCPFPHGEDKLHDDDEIRFDHKSGEGHVYFCRVCEARGDSVDFVKRTLDGSHGDVRRWILKQTQLDDWVSGKRSGDKAMIDIPRVQETGKDTIKASDLRELRQEVAELRQILGELVQALKPQPEEESARKEA